MTKRNPLANQFRSPAFRAWFDGSWLADEDGNPIVLYHGTRPGTDITAFELPNAYDGIYFTPDPLYAEGFTNELFADDKSTGGLFPVYLSIKNPFVVIADEGDETWEKFCYRGYNRQELESQGHDGAILIEKSTGVIDQVQAYHPTQIKSAIGNVGTFNPTISDIRYARTDPRYMFAGPQSETSDLELLTRARHLETIKAAPETIWRETGWMRGVDGSWRYEINDKDAKLNIGVPDAVEDEVMERVYREVVFSKDGEQLIKASYREGQPDHLATFGFTREQAGANLITQLIKREYQGIRSVESVLDQPLALPDLLDHPRLFAAYPRLRDMTVTFDPTLREVWGEFDPGGGISINPTISNDETLSILLHEVQHAIQEGEGFARGGQASVAFADRIRQHLKNLSVEQQLKVDEWAAHNKELLDAEQATSDTLTYGMMYQSMTRLMSYANREKPSGVLRLIRNETQWVYDDKVRQSPVVRQFDELQRNWFNLPKRHRMKARNLFLREQCAEAASLLRQVIPDPLIKQFREDERQLNNMIRSLERQASKARAKTQEYRQLQRGEKTAEALKERHSVSSAYEIYKSLAGEIEARNTQTRRSMSEEGRKALPPEQTADVKKDDAIVVFRDSNDFTVEVPFKAACASAGLRRDHPPRMKGLPKAEAQFICDSLMTGWKGKPPIHVVERISELPTALQADIWKQRAAQDVRAAFWKDRVYMLAPRLPDRNSLEEVLLHEIIGHYGLRKMLADELVPTLEHIYECHGQRSEAQDIRNRYFKAGEFDETNPEHRQLVAEELMAHLAESGEHQAMTDAQRMEAEVRAGLRKQGFQLPLTHTDLLHLLDGAERVVRRGGVSRPSEADINHHRSRSTTGNSGALAPSRADIRFRRAFHGSPHAFNQFSLEGIGSGEGAQAFGWGLYFAGRREVAEYYRDVLAEDQPLGCIAGWDVTGASDTAKELLRDLPMPSAIEYADQRQGTLRGLYDGVADELRQIQARGRGSVGHYLYEVDIPDDEDLLDADKPLTEQPPKVYERLKSSRLLETMGLEPWEVSAHMIDGHALYDFVRQWLVHHDEGWEALGKTPYDVTNVHQAASETFNRLGIPGLRYFDGGSRADTYVIAPPSHESPDWLIRDNRDNSIMARLSSEAEALQWMDAWHSHNYVIWDDATITIQSVLDEMRQANPQSRFSISRHTFDRLNTNAAESGQTDRESETLHKIERTPWHKGFPKVAFATPIGSAKAHPNFEAAKSGDIEAARVLVDDLVTEEAIDRLRQLVGERNPIVVPVVAEEATGANRIPAAYAARIAKALGLRAEAAIVQTVRANHTNAKADHRLANHAMFDGPVVPGEDYLIVDDTMAMGGTLAGLRGHIEKKRAHVIAATTLTGFGPGADLALSEKMRNALWRKHGDELDDYLKETFGFGIDSLTQGEAGHYKKAVSVDQIRDRIAAARLDQRDAAIDGLTSPTADPAMDNTAVIQAANHFFKQANQADLKLLLSKALFLYRWDTGAKLAWFDRDNALNTESTLADHWFNCHNIANQPHIDAANREDLTFSELVSQYRNELLNALSISNEGIGTYQMVDKLVHQVGTLSGQVSSFLETLSEQSRPLSDKASQALTCLNNEEWPFGPMRVTETPGFKRFYEGSQITTKEGQPQILYHTTNEDFTAFDLSDCAGTAGAGIYMTETPPKNEQYGTVVMPLYASIRRPADFTKGDRAINEMAHQMGLQPLSECTSMPELREWSGKFREGMLAQGYDGARLAGPEGETYVVAYHPNQVKSALGNSGLFNTTTADIRYSRSTEKEYPVSVDSMRDAVPGLILEAHKAYAAKDFKRAEDFDAQAETLLHRLEHALAEFEEDGLNRTFETSGDASFQEARFSSYIGSEEDDDADLEARQTTKDRQSSGERPIREDPIAVAANCVTAHSTEPKKGPKDFEPADDDNLAPGIC